MQYLIVLLLAVSASATYDYGHSYYPSTYGHGYGGYYGYGNLGYSGLGYGVGGYSYAPTSYYSGGGAISKYISPAVTSYAAPAAAVSYAAPAVSTIAAAPAVSYVKPAVTYAAAPAVSYVKPAVSYAAAPAVSYVKPAVSYAAAPAVSYVKPAVSYAAAPAVSYVKPAVTYAAAPAVSYVSRPAATYVAAAPRIQNPLVSGGGYIRFTMGSTRKDHSGITSSERGSAFNLHRNKAPAFPGSGQGKSAGFPEYPKPETDAVSGSSGFYEDLSKVKPGVEYADNKPGDSTHSYEKPSDSSFFDATKSSENDNSGYDSLKPDSNDKSSFDSDSFFDEKESSDTDRSGFEMTKLDSKDRKSFDSEKSTDGAGFESVKPLDKSGGSRFEIGKVDVNNQRREFFSRSAIKQSFLGVQKSPSSTDGQFLAGAPKIKFVMGRPPSAGLSGSPSFKTIPYPKRAFHSSLRDRIFYLSRAGEGPAYDYSSVYGPSASLLYDGGDAPFFLDGAAPEGEVIVYKKK